MSVELVTGYYGVGGGGEPKRHVSSTEDGARQAGTVGLGCYALSTGSKLSATMEDANTLVVADGDVVMNGRHVRLTETTSFTIPTGVQGQKVSNLAVLRYQVGSDSVESVTPLVLTGEPSTGEPTDPAYNEGSILDGDSPVDFPLYRVVTDGINAGDPEPLFDVTPSLAALRDSVSQKLDDIGVTTVGAQPAADWIFATAIRCPTGVVIGGNVTGNTIAQDSTILTVNLLKEAVPVYLVMRGFFHGHQSAARIEVSGSTLTVRMEQATSFSSGDTFGAFVPLTWA